MNSILSSWLDFREVHNSDIPFWDYTIIHGTVEDIQIVTRLLSDCITDPDGMNE